MTPTTIRRTYLFPQSQILYTGTVTTDDGNYVTLTDARRTGWAHWEVPVPGPLEIIDVGLAGTTVLGCNAVVWLDDGELHHHDYPQDLTADAATERDELLARLRAQDGVLLLSPADSTRPSAPRWSASPQLPGAAIGPDRNNVSRPIPVIGSMTANPDGNVSMCLGDTKDGQRWRHREHLVLVPRELDALITELTELRDQVNDAAAQALTAARNLAAARASAGLPELHGLCQHCRRTVKLLADGTWTHAEPNYVLVGCPSDISPGTAAAPVLCGSCTAGVVIPTSEARAGYTTCEHCTF